MEVGERTIASREWGRERGRDADRSGDGNKGSHGDRNEDGIGDGKREVNGEGRRGGGEFLYPEHQEISKVEDQTLPLRTWHHLCRYDMALAGSKQLRAQDPAPTRRSGTEGRTGHEGWVEERCDGNRDGDGNGDEGRDEGENGSGNRDKNRDEGGGEKERERDWEPSKW